MTSANSAGGVMGKMIDAQSIVVASTACRLEGREADVFKAVFWHSLVLASLVGLARPVLRLRHSLGDPGFGEVNSCGHAASRLRLLAALGLAVSAPAAEPGVRLITLDPGHFHAGLIQKEMYPGVDPTVHVYAPLGPDLLAHLGRVSAFNRRAENARRAGGSRSTRGPTSWSACCARSRATSSSSRAATAARWTASWPPSRAA